MPLLWISAAFIAGVVLGDSMDLPASLWLGLSAAVFMSWFPCMRYASPYFNHMTGLLRARLPQDLIPSVPILVLAAFIGLGAARAEGHKPKFDERSLAFYNDTLQMSELEGVIIAPPVGHDSWTELRVQVDQVRRRGELLFLSVSGLALVQDHSGEAWHYGDRVRISGEVLSPPADEDSSYRDYLARHGIYSLVRPRQIHLLRHDQGNLLLAVVYGIHTHGLKTVYRLFPDPEAGLLAGILLGDESGISPELQEDFRQTGASHVIAISGFNFSLITALLVSFTSRLFGKRKGAVAAAAGIVFYTVLVGAGAGVVRAALMSGITLLGRQFNRRQNGLNTLAFVAAVMAVADPNVLWDVSFQLSFSATLGLVLYAEPLQKRFEAWATGRLPAGWAQRLSGPVGEYFLFTMAAQIVGLPVSLYHFQRFSLIAWVANPLILPAQPALMVVGWLAVGLGMILPGLGQIAALLAWPFLLYTIRVVEVLAQAPGGSQNLGEIRLVMVMIFYLVLFGATYLRAHPGLLPGSVTRVARPSLAFSSLALLAALTWRLALNTPDGDLHLTFLNVGSGEAVLVQTPDGRSLLINGGSSPTRLAEGLGRRLPLGERQLDWLVVGASGEENISALADILERFPPERVLLAGAPAGTSAARQLQRVLLGWGIPVVPAAAGQHLDLGQGARLEVLAAGRSGAVLLVEWEAFRMMLPLGVDAEMLKEVRGRQPGPYSALFLAEGGSVEANPPEWIAACQPQLVILSGMAADAKGRPHPGVLEAVQGYPIMRTDLNGWIEITTDGKQMWVDVEKW